MDNFDLKPERKKFNPKSVVWNFLTVCVLLGICMLAYLFLTIYTNPSSPINPFPPHPTPTFFQTVTPTNTIIPREATWTPTSTIQPSPSRTKAPTWTLLPEMITITITPSATNTLPQATAAKSSTPLPVSVEVTYLASTEFHPDKSCDWLGVAGKVMGVDGKPAQDKAFIQLGGILNGKAVDLLTVSGDAILYGPSGFELVLGNRPIASTQTLWIQLLDNTTKPMTDRIYFDTYDGCTQNLVLMVFTKNR
jgi:hypothetical protein